MKTTKTTIAIYLCLFLIMLTGKSFADEPTINNLKGYDIATLEKKWVKYTADKGFKNLLEVVKKEGFTRIANNDKYAWGFEGSLVQKEKKQPEASEVCGFDFYKKTSTGMQMCSMVWRQVGNKIYKCYIMFPPGETNTQKAFENSQEFYADEKGNIQKAHSFGRCFSKCVFEKTLGFCGSALAVCGTISAGVALASGGTITTPVAIAIFASCAGVGCLLPFALCAVRCN